VGLVVLAFAIALPISRVVTTRWLEQFQYHVASGWTLYLLTGAFVVLLTYATVGYQAVKAAIVNPADSLRSE
jgi:putative ABC transport system permease protein